MGEAKRRRILGAFQKSDIKISPRKREMGFRVVHHQRIEHQDDTGMVYARNAFRVVDDNGQTVVEETVDGPKPVLLLSVPQPVRRAVFAAPTLLRG